MSNSTALLRVQQHRYPGHGPRQEGIFLSLNDLEFLTNYLRTNSNASTQGINYVAFMIGKLNTTGRNPHQIDSTMPAGAAGARFDEYTVEVLPFHGTLDAAGTIISANFMTEVVAGVTVNGALTIPGHPFDNSQGGGGGGNQKTPPPTT